MSLVARFRGRLRQASPLAVDVVLTLAVLLAQLAPFTSMRGAWSPALYAPILGASLPLLFRRRFPLTAMLAVLVSVPFYDIVGDGPHQPIWYGWLITVYTMADRCPRRRRLAAIVITVSGALTFTGSIDTGVRGVATWLAAYALGRAAALRREQAAALKERAVRLERERELEAERAAQQERTRIARDMHDILAHAVSLMIVQAESGPLVVRTDPARAEAAFDAIATSGRTAMGQLRRMLGVLKDNDGPRDSLPSLERLAELADRVGATGLCVTVDEEGQRRDLRSDVDVAAYRIIQESLTNIVKHAGADTAHVRLRWKEDALRITVTDDGRGPGSGPPAAPDGQGLIGIRERAAACGGTAWFGSVPGARGSQVDVRLPLGADA